MAALLLLLLLSLSCLSSFGRWKRWSQAVVERVLWSVLRLVRAYFFDNRIERAGPVNLLKAQLTGSAARLVLFPIRFQCNRRTRGWRAKALSKVRISLAPAAKDISAIRWSAKPAVPLRAASKDFRASAGDST